MKLYQTIVYNLINPKERVIDLGCGNGLLLSKLRQSKKCDGYGIEKNFEEVLFAVDRGLPVFQGDVLEGLRQFESNSFDVAILSQTLQQVIDPALLLKEMCRVSKRTIVTFPNFGYWKVRFQLLSSGYSPKTKHLPYDWYNTPNIRVITIKDFRNLCKEQGLSVIKEVPLAKFKFQRLLFPLKLTNFFTEKGIFVIENKK